jgi:DNA invertase Pin-like site-specific DNA recombinase
MASTVTIAYIAGTRASDARTYRTRLEAHAARAKLSLAAVFVEKPQDSARPLDERPQLLAALDGLYAHRATVLLVPGWDRLGKKADRAVALYLVAQRGATIRAATGRGEEAALKALLEVIGAHERASRALRTAPRASSVARRRGMRAWGFRAAPNGGVEVDETERRVVELVRRLHARGAKLREIVQALGAARLTNRRGKPIGMTRVFEIIHGGRKATRVSVSSGRRADR